ncbi:hypothetical protein WJX74_006761 [Apatococcus lobatus]|uniref:EXPERA domain-containing protein n=1 Tax=Apatococcus lobatus TaxID=904363 RepID=A0AAW1SAD8_9CHLO
MYTAGWKGWSVLLLAQDAVFILGATTFLLAGEHYGTSQHPQAVSYPGPFVDTDSETRLPAYFLWYVVTAWAPPAVVIPCAGIIWLASKGQAALAAATLIPYLMVLIAQVLTEECFKRRCSPMWPQVPMVYMAYRFWQLLRSCWLSTLLPMPTWLEFLSLWCLYGSSILALS